MTRRTKSLLLAGSLFLFSSCASDSHDGKAHDHSAMPVDAASVMGEPDQPITGPQGRVGQFVVECPFSHALSDDPIIYPGDAGASHLHAFLAMSPPMPIQLLSHYWTRAQPVSRHSTQRRIGLRLSWRMVNLLRLKKALPIIEQVSALTLNRSSHFPLVY
jgi:hypothetical protein